MASIRFQNVTKRFGDTLAVADASFEIRDNAFFCLFGPPLAGKSTILKLILGLETPDSGEIFIDEKPASHLSPAERNVAMVFQNLALFPHMTAKENIRFPLVERRIAESEIAARLAEVSEKLHIGHILHKPPEQLSGGERQRVAIARALVRDPAAYLMDDPISALDARLREETRVELRRIQKEKRKTLVYVTHDQEEAMSVADSMAVLEEGHIRQIGSPQEIYNTPRSIYVAELLGAPRINLIDRALAPAVSLAELPADATRIGIRPESMRVSAGAGDAGKAVITDLEPLGAFTTLTVDAGGTTLRASLRGQPAFRAGQRVQLSVDPDKTHFFDRAGQAIGPAA